MLYTHIYTDVFKHIIFNFGFCIRKAALQNLNCNLFLLSHWKYSKFIVADTLSKCPGGHPILRRGLKLNSNISAGKCKKK